MIGLGSSAGNQKSISPPTLHFQGWSARPMTDEDAPFVYGFLNDPDVAATRIAPAPTELSTAQAWIADAVDDPAYVPWILQDAESRDVGMIELKELNLRLGSAEVGFLVIPVARRKGLASAALRAVSEWAFTTLAIDRLYLIHDVGNEGSCSVAKAGGYRSEGILRSARPTVDGRRVDSEIHSRLRTDPFPGESR